MGHHGYDHALAPVAVPGCSADEVEGPGAIEVEDGVSGVGEEVWAGGVALLVLCFGYFQNRVLLVPET